MRCNTAITVYNRYYDPTVGHDRWQRTFIEAAYWHKTTKTTVTQTGLIAANEITIRIPSPVDGFVTPEDWKDLQDKTDRWTLQPGDRIVKGESTREITKPAELVGAATILGWVDARYGLNPQWKVICS